MVTPLLVVAYSRGQCYFWFTASHASASEARDFHIPEKSRRPSLFQGYHFRAGDVHVIFFCFRTLNACSTARAIAACTRMVIEIKAIRNLRM